MNGVSEAALELFRGKGGCTACHTGPNLTDEKFHNTGVAWQNGHLADKGRFALSGNALSPRVQDADAPRCCPNSTVLHDGSLETLEDVIDFYSEEGRPNSYLDAEIRPRRFTPQEKRALAAFLRSLTGKIREGI